MNGCGGVTVTWILWRECNKAMLEKKRCEIMSLNLISNHPFISINKEVFSHCEGMGDSVLNLMEKYSTPHELCIWLLAHYTLRFNEVERGVYWFHLVRPSVRLWTESCPLCIFWQILYICNFYFVFFWLGIEYDSIVWVIMRRRRVSSERRHSSCSSCVLLWFSNGWFYPYSSGLLHWHWLPQCQWRNPEGYGYMIVPALRKQPWRIWINESHKSTKNDNIMRMKMKFCRQFSACFINCIVADCGVLHYNFHDATA